jgi:hypothetical protein
VELRQQLYQIHKFNNSKDYHKQVTTLVVSQDTLIFFILASNDQGIYFLTIKTTNAVGQADMWVQPDTWIQGNTCAEFKTELEFEFVQDLE